MIFLTLAHEGTEGFIMVLENCFKNCMWENLDLKYSYNSNMKN